MAKKGEKLSEETKKRMSIAQKGNGLGLKRWPNGRVFSEEWKQKLSQAKKGKPLSEEHKKRIGLGNKGNKSKEDVTRDRKKYMAEWISKNYEKKLWFNNQRRVKKLNNGGSHTLAEWETLKAQYNWTCPACKKLEPGVTLSRDHIIPISKGGSDNIENIQPLCRGCNSRKKDKFINKY